MNFKKFEGGFVTLGNNLIAKISGKGTLSLDGGKTKTHDVLYVEGLKYNLLSVSQMCDKGYKLSFSVDGCEIRESNTSELIVEGSGTNSDIYHLSKLNGKFVSFHRRMKVGFDTKG